MNIALYIFYKSVRKIENNTVYFREFRCEMLFHDTRFIMMLNYCMLFKIFSWFLHLDFLCLLHIYSLFSEEIESDLKDSVALYIQIFIELYKQFSIPMVDPMGL